MTSYVSEQPNTDPVSQRKTVIRIKGYVKIHLMFMLAYWVAITTSIVVLQQFHHPDLYWIYSVSFGYDLVALLLSILPIMIVMSVNMNQMRKLLENRAAERNPLSVIITLLGVAIVFLIPITWFMRNLYISLIFMSVITAIVAWIAFCIYVVSARAIHTDKPVQFMTKCFQRPIFWLSFITVSLIITISLVPVIGGILAFEFYSFEELLVRRLPAILLFGFQSALMIPLMPLILEMIAEGRQISWLWE